MNAARLHGVHHPEQVTATEALTWLHGDDPSASTTIGYLLAPDRAQWFTVDHATAQGPTSPRELTRVFELVTSDGRRQLRWLHQADGRGRAVAAAEDPTLLPIGVALPEDPGRYRFDDRHTRRLAGTVTTHPASGWATLTSARFAPAEVPVTAARGDYVMAEFAEYVVGDEHGNLSVVDTLLLGLVRYPREASTR